jgi:hypothetical protein
MNDFSFDRTNWDSLKFSMYCTYVGIFDQEDLDKSSRTLMLELSRIALLV